MINSLRTVLLNQPATSQFWPGEEYVPPTFHAQTIPGNLSAIWSILFGVGSDRAHLNWRLRNYLTILHASELAGYVTALDPRITYWPFGNDLFNVATAGPQITVLANPQAQTLEFYGPIAVTETANQLKLQWLVTVTSSSQVQILQNFAGGGTSTLAYAMNNGWSNPLTLPGSTLQIQFSSGVGGSWQIDALAAPSRDLSGIFADLAGVLDDNTKNVLFGAVGSGEPWRTFRNLWEQHDQMPYRLGGVVLALGYQLAGQTPA